MMSDKRDNEGKDDKCHDGYDSHTAFVAHTSHLLLYNLEKKIGLDFDLI